MADGSAAKLTPFAKIFILVVVVGVIGIAGVSWYWSSIKCWASPSSEGCGGAGGSDGEGGHEARRPDTPEDFAPLANAPQDPDRNAPQNVQAPRITGGRLNRPLRVGINTWAGHAPGIVANNGLHAGNANSIYMRAHNGLQVELSIMDDPAAKLAAFQAGEIDIMWDTVDSWAREAAVLADNHRQGRAIIMEDWSRGGDGIAAIREITSVEQLRGRRIATTQFTPSHWLLLYLLAQSGLTPQQREEVENNLVFAAEAPAAAAMFRARQVDAAVTWEPDLSSCIQGRGQGAHVLVSTTAATNVIADVLVARQEVIQEAPETIAAFVAGWFEGIEAMRQNPAGTNEVIGEALNLDQDTVSGMLSGLKLTPFADNALFFGLTGEGEGHYNALFSTAHRIWRRRGVINTSVRPADTLDSRFVAAVADSYRGQEVVEAPVQAPAQPSEADVPIINRQLSIHFTTGSAEIMPGSYFTLDALAETMVSFGGTVLRIEGNTDSTGQRDANVRLSQERADAVRAYLVQNHDIPAERVQTIGYGPDRPIAENNSEEGRSLNRRTDIRVVLAPSAAPAP